MSKCDQCQVMVINGTATHEHGCPNSWLHPLTGEPYPKECVDCGCDFIPSNDWEEICEDCGRDRYDR